MEMEMDMETQLDQDIPENNAELSDDSSAKRISLSGKLNLTQAEPLKAFFQEARGSNVIVDVEDVIWLGAQCLQVLLAARALWELDGLDIKFVGCDGNFARWLGYLGCERELMGESYG